MSDTSMCKTCCGLGEIFIDRSFIEGKYESGFEVCPRCHGAGFHAGFLATIKPKYNPSAAIDAAIHAIEEFKERECYAV